MFQTWQDVWGRNAGREVEFVDDHFRRAVLDDLAVLRQRMAGVERNRHRAQPRHGIQHDDKLNAVAEHHGDAIAPLDPKRPEAPCGLPYEGVELGIAQPRFAADERKSMRAARDCARQHLVYALRPLDEATDHPAAIVQLIARRRMAVPIQPSVHGAPHLSTGVERTGRVAAARLSGAPHTGFSSPPSQSPCRMRPMTMGEVQAHPQRAAKINAFTSRAIRCLNQKLMVYISLAELSGPSE